MDNIESLKFEELSTDVTNPYENVANIGILYNVPVVIKAKLGNTMLSVEEILKLDNECIIQLNSAVGDPIELYANDILIGYGEIVVVNEDIGIKVTKINISEAVEKISENLS